MSGVARRSRAARIALGVLLALGLAALLAPLLTPYIPDAIDLAQRRGAPSLTHPFGTDELGRDVLTRTLFGARISLSIGLLSAAVTAAVGVTIGAASGYFRGVVDSVLMRVTDAMLAIPTLPLLMIAAAIFDPSVILLVLLVGLAGWMETARVVRAEFLSLTKREFVAAARVGGSRHSRVVWRHLLPNAAAPVIVATTLAVGRGILVESAMSFFGVGVQPPTASWGNMLYQAQSTMSTEPWVALFPGMLIFITVLSINLLGDEIGVRREPAAYS